MLFNLLRYLCRVLDIKCPTPKIPIPVLNSHLILVSDPYLNSGPTLCPQIKCYVRELGKKRKEENRRKKKKVQEIEKDEGLGTEFIFFHLDIYKIF